jgi:hypothetical protein
MRPAFIHRDGYNASPKEGQGKSWEIRLTINKAVQFSVLFIFGSVGIVAGFFPIFWFNAMLLFSGGFFVRRRKMK